MPIRPRSFRSGVLTLTSVCPVENPGLADAAERFSFRCGAQVDDLDLWTFAFMVRVRADEVDADDRPTPATRYVWFLSDLEMHAVDGSDWPADQITSRSLERVPVTAMCDAVRAWAMTSGAAFGPTVDSAPDLHARWGDWLERFRNTASGAKVGGRGRPRRYTDDDLRIAAEQAIDLSEIHGHKWRAELAERRGLLDSWDTKVAGSRVGRLVTEMRRSAWLKDAPGRGSHEEPKPGDRLLAAWASENNAERLARWASDQPNGGTL